MDNKSPSAMSNITEMSKASSSGCDDIPWAWFKAANKTLFEEPRDVNYDCLPVKLLPWLWLSDQRHAEQANRMMELGITHVLSTNAMHEEELRRLQVRCQRVNIQHHSVKGYDSVTYDMIGNHLKECLEILQAVQKSPDQRIVVHCAAGTNRSGLIACAAIMLLERRTLLEVVQEVKKKRGMLLTNLGFQRQLCELAMREDLLGTKPEGYTDDPVHELIRHVIE